MAIAAAVVLVGSACDSSPQEKPGEPPRIADLAKAPVDLTKHCPEPVTDLPYPPQGVLPDGATVIRLCRAPGATEVDRFRPPVDALTKDAQSVIDRINSSTPADPEVGCTYQGGFTADVWIGYPDGRATAVRVDTGGCGWTQVEPSNDWAQGQRLGTEGVLRTYSNALWAQRRTMSPPERDFPRRHCTPLYQPITLLALPADADLSQGALCMVDAKVRQHRALVPAGLLRRAVTTRAHPGCIKPSGTILRAWTTWGDPVTLIASRCTWLSFAGLEQSWTPGLGAARELRALRFGPPHDQYDEQGHVIG